jgi:hypothetical protein
MVLSSTRRRGDQPQNPPCSNWLTEAVRPDLRTRGTTDATKPSEWHQFWQEFPRHRTTNGIPMADTPSSEGTAATGFGRPNRPWNGRVLPLHQPRQRSPSIPILSSDRAAQSISHGLHIARPRGCAPYFRSRATAPTPDGTSAPDGHGPVRQLAPKHGSNFRYAEGGSSGAVPIELASVHRLAARSANRPGQPH